MAAHILVLRVNADADPHFWSASRRLDRCGPDEVQHDGGTFMAPRHAGDQVCREVTAVNIQTGKRDPAVIVRLGSTHS